MNHRLIYVVGPSGAGKDSVLSWLRQHTFTSAPVYWTRRTIDRPQSDRPDAEDHDSVDAGGFDQLLAEGQFALHWQANTHRYGIRSSELASLKDPNTCVWVNGSRAHLPIAALAYPNLTVVHITADAQVLRQRLMARGRESSAAVEARMQRSSALDLPSGCRLIEIHNNATLDEAGAQLLVQLRNQGLWPISA